MKPMSVIVRTVCNVFTWFLMVFGAYVIIHGHLTPGGGFQGGAVVATGAGAGAAAGASKRVLYSSSSTTVRMARMLAWPDPQS